jgi:hypothetical protein
MFQTGSGKSVLISESSVQKARAVLEEEGNIKKGISAYQICETISLMQQLLLYFQKKIV